MLYKFSLHNREEFRKVCHFGYNSFSGMIRVKVGGISQNILMKIGYKSSDLYSLHVQSFSYLNLGFVTNPKLVPRD
jgi:hypothetical protein